MFAALKSVFGYKDWPEYTRDEVAKHNTPDSIWLVAGERVFDVTSFVNQHPAGAAALLKRAGGCADCTQDYKFHSKGARAQWRSCQVGVLSVAELAKPIPKQATMAASPAASSASVAAASPLSMPETVKALVPMASPPNMSVSAEEDDGGEDPVACGSCCRSVAPSDACKTCPNAPKCIRRRAMQEGHQVGADAF